MYAHSGPEFATKVLDVCIAYTIYIHTCIYICIYLYIWYVELYMVNLFIIHHIFRGTYVCKCILYMYIYRHRNVYPEKYVYIVIYINTYIYIYKVGISPWLYRICAVSLPVCIRIYACLFFMYTKPPPHI